MKKKKRKRCFEIEIDTRIYRNFPLLSHLLPSGFSENLKTKNLAIKHTFNIEISKAT